MAFENLNKAGIAYLLGKLKNVFVQIKDSVRSVNGITPDEDGDITVTTVQNAETLVSESSHINEGTFIARTAGQDSSVNSGDAWLMRIQGNSVHTGFTPESITMTVTAEREEGDPITADIDRDTFVSYVTESGTTTLVYSTAWSANPALYGITVTGTPVAGDIITVVYVKEVRGTITVSDPTEFTATGWNLYNHTNGYARVLKYSNTYGFRIEGTYTSIKFASTPTGTQTDIDVTSGNFTVPSDGYVIVTGGNATDTVIYMTWEDWTEEESYGTFSEYNAETIDLSGVMDTYFPNGLLAVEGVRDEINLNIGQAINRVERLAYTAEDLADAKASGRPYEYDENYIYLALATPETHSISVSGAYTVNDHGMEWFDSDVAIVSQNLYGNNLKNKLERDVLTISQQTLNSTQKAQVQTNLGLGTAATKSVANNVTTTTEGSVLDARQGYNITHYATGDTITIGQYLIGVANNAGTSLLIDIAVPKSLPSNPSFTTTYAKPSSLYKWDGTGYTVPTAASLTVSRQSAYCIRVSISGLSVTGSSIYKIAFAGVLYATLA